MSAHKPVTMVEVGPPSLELAARPAHADARDLIELVRGELARHGEVVPPDEQLLVVARVVAGYLRTSPLPDGATTRVRLLAVQAFAATTFGWWTREVGDYRRVATPLEVVFHQRETPPPDAATMDMLLAMTVGLLRQRQIRPTESILHLLVADWLVALYLAGHDPW